VTLAFKPVRDLLDVEAMRVVRNACREYMTRDTKEITPAAQAAWWANLTAGDPDFETWKPHLVWDGSTVLGYGILWHGERVQARQWAVWLNAWWLTGGLLPGVRGKGYGRWLFERLIELAGDHAWLEVRADNIRARMLYESLGFKFVSGDATHNRITMQRSA
jgi:ribosomal protein S18 acetylase RimI-like enzyme